MEIGERKEEIKGRDRRRGTKWRGGIAE